MSKRLQVLAMAHALPQTKYLAQTSCAKVVQLGTETQRYRGQNKLGSTRGRTAARIRQQAGLARVGVGGAGGRTPGT